MSDLLTLIYRDADDLLEQVHAALERGADPNQQTEYGETPLRVASRNARVEVIRALLDAGADATQLEWTDLFFAVAFGTDADLEAALDTADLSARDGWERTPWLLAIQLGRVEAAARLLAAGSDRGARGRGGKTPLAYAVSGDHRPMVSWLVSIGEDIEGTDDLWGATPLIAAAEADARDCVELLIELGADIFAENNIPNRAIQVTDDVAIVRMLLAAGENINDLGGDMRARLTGLAASEPPEISIDDFRRARHRRFGRANPEPADEPFWQLMIRTRASGYWARERFGDDACSGPPVWSFDRFGMSITDLGDGRYIEIAGEHEDHYDPDFCIYNDVFVHDGRGDCAIYLYPSAVFPPTDFHSATLVGDQIWIIGNLGYPDHRRPGQTPVFTLDVGSLAIQRVATVGELPGWIHSHRADRVGDEIVIRGGKRIELDTGGQQVYVDNDAVYSLSLASRAWTKIALS